MDHWSILLAYSAYPAVLAALAPRIRFSLHKEFRDGEIRLYLHKEFRAAELGGDASENGDFQRRKQRLQGTNVFQEISFYIQKEMNGWGRCVGKWRFSMKETAFARSKLFSGTFILYSERNEQLGAMRQKMAIFKEGNSGCRVHAGALISYVQILNFKI